MSNNITEIPDWVTHIWSSYGHRFLSAGGDNYEDRCLTCGAEYRLVGKDDGRGYEIGHYVTTNGEDAQECTGNTDMVHGSERHCENDNGRPCEANSETGTCVHVAHDCNCMICN